MSAEHNAKYLVWKAMSGDPGYEPDYCGSTEEVEAMLLEAGTDADGWLVTRAAIPFKLTVKLEETE